MNTTMTFYDPMSGGDHKVRNVWTIVDDQSMRYESFEADGKGGERKMMIIEYKRK